MSHRRGGGGPSKEEMTPFSENLEQPLSKDSETQSTVATESLSVDRGDTKQMRIKQWKEGPFAATMTVSWEEERAKYKGNCSSFLGTCISNVDSSDGMPCICCSAFACSKIGAGRVGHMAVLKQSTEWVEEMEEDEEGETRVRRFTRPKLDIVVGPYWPMLCMVTYPLILGVSGLTLYTRIPEKHPLIVLVWLCCTMGLIAALALTAFRDPGILPRYERPPPTLNGSSWRWSDRTHTYRPRGAFYDPDTGVIVEDFDHTCPWTGTAIGKKNLHSFHAFVCLIFVCLIFDIVLLTGGL